MTGRPLVLAIVLAALASQACAQAAGQWKDSRQLWGATCGYCHDAGLAPRLLGLNLPPAAIRSAVRSGPGGMPQFTPSQISDAELRALADWLNRQPPPASAPAGAH